MTAGLARTFHDGDVALELDIHRRGPLRGWLAAPKYAEPYLLLDGYFIG